MTVADYRVTLKGARANAGLTQTELAGLLGVDTATISRWENGSTDIPATKLFEFCAVTDTPIEALILPVRLVTD